MYWQLIEKTIFKKAQFIHVESEDDRMHVLELLPEAKIVLSPCGIFPAVFRQKGPDGYLTSRWNIFKDKRCILYLARIDVNKGVNLLLKAYSQVKDIFTDTALLIVGPDFTGTKTRMKKLSSELGIEDSVVWAGSVSDKERVWILQQCNVYVLQ